MTFHEYMKNVNRNPAKYAHIEKLARDAEIQREREEDIALDEYYNSKQEEN